jgi:hypothetical protein
VGKSRKDEKDIANRGAYATLADFKRIFSEDVNSLYLLSLLLTGTPDQAEECFVEGIGESTKGNYVFKEWARSWARRTIIQSAIRLIAPMEYSRTVSRSADVARGMKAVGLHGDRIVAESTLTTRDLWLEYASRRTGAFCRRTAKTFLS